MADRETLDVDILIVGGGPAGLAAALRLGQLQKQKGGEPLSIAVIEKAREAGLHQLSGALLDPSTLRDLIPDFQAKGAPLTTPVHQDNIYFLTPTHKVRLPITPPPFRNHGNYIISLSQFTKWLAGQVEAEGIDLYMGFSGQQVLYDGTRVIGVRTGDRGIGKDGKPKGAFELGADIHAKVTIFADGVRGHLTKQIIQTLDLGLGSEPAQFAIGIKELWDVPKERLAPGTVIHTLGYPLRDEEFGGSWLYALPDGRLSIGFVVGLDYKDPLFDPTCSLPAFQASSVHQRHPRRWPDRPIRRQGPSGRRLEHAAAAPCRWRPDRRGRGQLRELDPAQGHPPGHAERHAGCRGGFRWRAIGRHHVRGVASLQAAG